MANVMERNEMKWKLTDDDEVIKLYFANRIEGNYQPRSIFQAYDTVVMHGMPHPIEYVHGKIPHDIELYFDLKHVKVCTSMEGTAILIFHHGDKWYVSTHKRLDAFNSYWADKDSTFGRSFAMGLAVAAGESQPSDDHEYEYVSGMCDKHLDKTRKYIFVLPAKYSERIGTVPVVAWPRPVQALVMDKQFRVIEGVSTFPGVYEPTVEVIPPTMDTLVEMVRRCDYNSCQGYYIRRPGQRLQTKLYNKIYYDRMVIRGNNPNLKVAYMDCRYDPGAVRLFMNTYSDFKWMEVENEIAQTCKDIIELDKCKGTKRSIPQGVVAFDYKELTRSMRTIDNRQLIQLSKYEPRLFNRVMKNRKRAIRSKTSATKTEEDDINQDMFDQMDALEEFEFSIGTRQI